MANKTYTLITGACGGLGKAISLECGRHKWNLILVDLPNTGLNRLEGFIKKNYAVDVICFEKNLAETTACEELYFEISSMNLSIDKLVNNVGISTNLLFEEGQLALFQYQVRLNILAATSLTHLFLAMLQKNSPSYLLNVGSIGGSFCLSRKQVYNATKAYIASFTKSIRKEVAKDKITVSLLCPGGMNTNHTATLINMSGSWVYRQSIMNPEKVAAIGIKKMLEGKKVIVPGLMNQFFLLLNILLPGFLKDRISNTQLKNLSNNNQLVNNYSVNMKIGLL